MFDRLAISFHDKQKITPEDLTRFVDAYSAKYLKSCFNPDFPVRVRELEIPKIPIRVIGIDRLSLKFSSRDEVM